MDKIDKDINKGKIKYNSDRSVLNIVFLIIIVIGFIWLSQCGLIENKIVLIIIDIFLVIMSMLLIINFIIRISRWFGSNE